MPTDRDDNPDPHGRDGYLVHGHTRESLQPHATPKKRRRAKLSKKTEARLGVIREVIDVRREASRTALARRKARSKAAKRARTTSRPRRGR